MNIEKVAWVFFGFYTIIILSGGMLAVFARSLVRALAGLVITLFGVAGLYLLMAAPFMAFMQLLIYVGAIVVLIFLAIMLTGAGGWEEKMNTHLPHQYLLTLTTATAALSVLGSTVIRYRLQPQALPDQVEIITLGKALMNDYILPFELISVVLFVAMAGAVLLGFERKYKKNDRYH